MAQRANFYNKYEVWGSCFFNTKDSETKNLTGEEISDLLQYFSKKFTSFFPRWIAGVFSSCKEYERITEEKYLQTTKEGKKFLRFPKYLVKISGENFILAFRINICRNLNIIKNFYYLQSEKTLNEEKILTVSKDAKAKVEKIAKNIEKSITSDSYLANLFNRSIKKETFDLYICNVNTLDENLGLNINKLMENFDKSIMQENKDIQHTLMFLYNLNEDRAVSSLAELRNEVITKYSDNQFTTTKVKGLKGFYIYYIKKRDKDKSSIYYLGIAPYKSIKSMHTLNRNIAIAYAKNT